MNRPNFFIVGAPKCGTTALSEYLRQHSQVYMTEPKEPHYFAEDFDGHRPIRNEKAYLELFRNVKDTHKAIGEGSVWYLYSKTALENIYAFNPHARIIAMLRNPIDVVPSLHRQHLVSMYEDVQNIEQAWNLQHTRLDGLSIPRLCRQPELLQYGPICCFSNQIEKLMEIFPKEQIQIILFDDFVSHARRTYISVLDFLGLEDDGRNEFPKINESSVLRESWLGLLPRYVPVGVRNLITNMRFNPILRLIPALGDRVFKQSKPRSPLDPVFRHELIEYYREDIKRLENLIGRDLGHWLK